MAYRTACRLLRPILAAVLIFSSPLAAAASPANYQGLWWNSPAGSESGWGISFAHQGDVIFATWFTYDDAGDGWWMVMTANKTAEGTYGGTLLETRGPPFHAVPFDPAKVTSTAVGSGTLTFRDPDNGTFSYTVKGVSQTKSITRQVYGPLPTCAYGSQPDFAAATNYQDLWWVANGAESGWGINLAHQGDVIFATWFTYDGDGTPLWLVATAPKAGAGVYAGQLLRTTHPPFSTTPFDPAKVSSTVVGSATLTFANGNSATLAYTLHDVFQTKAITRQLFVPPAGTVCTDTQSMTITGKVMTGYPLEKAVVCADANRNATCDPDEVQTVSDAAGAYQLAAPPGFNGSLVSLAIAGQTRESGTSGATVDVSFRMASPAQAYSANITPYTTLVQLTRENTFKLAEEFVRNELGLPPGYLINLKDPPPDGSLPQAVAKSVVIALKATAETLDLSAPDALAQVVAAFPTALTDLPQLRITTKNGVPIDSKEVYVDATFALTNPAASPAAASLNGKIRGRGNSTWLEPKKPYKVQFSNDASYAKIPDFLGMKKNRNWALLADHNDRSLIRNKLALTLGNSSVMNDGLKWSPSGQHLEVFVNGAYVGVYLLTEDIRIDPARLNIKKMSTSPAVNDIDGGYIVEVDVPLDCYNDGIIDLQHVTPQGAPFCISRPDEADITPAQQAYIKKLINATENDIYGMNSLAMINPVSYADWYLLNELFKNNDATFYSSDYMWKDTAAAANPADRLFNMGPIWDFDISAGNINYNGNWYIEGCWVSQAETGRPNWSAKLLDIPKFLNLTLARWMAKRPGIEKVVNSGISTFSRRLESAQQRNFARWPVLGTQGSFNYYIFNTYADEVAFLKKFLNERMKWLDIAYANPQAFATLCK